MRVANNQPWCRRAGWAFALTLLSAPLPTAWAQQPGPSQSALAGSRVFGAKGCAKCHAINGIGKSVGPDLARAGLRSYYDLAAGFWNHFIPMAGRMREAGIEPPRLSSQEMGDLIAFLSSVNAFGTPGDAQKGQALFTRKECVRCHQVGRIGGVVGPNLDYLGYAGPIRVAAAMWNHLPAMTGELGRRGLVRPSFTAAELKDLLAYFQAASTGTADVAAYLLPGRADQGRKLMAAKGCMKCHAVRGQGATVAPDLASRDRSLTLFEFAALLWNKAPVMVGVMRAQGIKVPEIEPAEMADIVAYLQSVQYFKPEGDAVAGRRLLSNRGCFGCHPFEESGAGTARDLAKARGLDSPAAVIAALWNHARLAASEGDRARWSTITAEEMADMAAFLINAGSAR